MKGVVSSHGSYLLDTLELFEEGMRKFYEQDHPVFGDFGERAMYKPKPTKRRTKKTK